MAQKLNDASAWRIEFAKELVRYYTHHEGIKMIVLGGSPGKGLSDAYSDLDIVVYWDTIDKSFLEDVPLKKAGLDRKFYRQMGEEDVYLESYYINGLKADFGHATMHLWEQWVDEVMVKLEVAPDKQQSLGGFIRSVPMHGEDLFRQWKTRIEKYPDQLTEKMIKSHLRFFHNGVLQHQGLERGDIIFFYDGICMVLKNILGILAGLNKLYYSPAEPRWVEYELNRMSIKPEKTWERMQSIFNGDRNNAEGILYGLVVDTLNLVGQHMPEMDLSRLKKGLSINLQPCHSKPVIP